MILTYILLLVLGQCIVMDNAFAVLLPLQNNTNCQNDCEMIIIDQQNVYQKFREKVRWFDGSPTAALDQANRYSSESNGLSGLSSIVIWKRMTLTDSY